MGSSNLEYVSPYRRRLAPTSERSIRWAARNKVNAVTVPEPTSRLKRNIEIYYEEAEKHRGFGCCRYVHILRPGHEREDLQRYREPLELQWDYYGPFGFAAVLSDLGEPNHAKGDRDRRHRR